MRKKKAGIIICSLLAALVLFYAAFVISGYGAKERVRAGVNAAFEMIRQGVSDDEMEEIIDQFISAALGSSGWGSIANYIQDKLMTGEDINDIYHALVQNMEYQVTGIESAKSGHFRVGVQIRNINNVQLVKESHLIKSAVDSFLADKDISQELAHTLTDNADELIDSGEAKYVSNDFVIDLVLKDDDVSYEVENGGKELLLTCAGIPVSSVPAKPVDDPGATPLIISLLVIALVILLIDILLFRKLNGSLAAATGDKDARFPESMSSDAHADVGIQERAVLSSLSEQHGGMMLAVHDTPLLIGRDPSACKVVFREGTVGISGRHCSISYDGQNKAFILTDLQSTYGTFLSDGRRLQPGEPVYLASGSGFYAGDPANAFLVEVK